MTLSPSFVVSYAADRGTSLVRASLLLGGAEWRTLADAGLCEAMSHEPFVRERFGPELAIGIFNARTPALARDALTHFLRDLAPDAQEHWMAQPWQPGKIPLWLECADRFTEPEMGSAQRARARACWSLVQEAAGPDRWQRPFEVKTHAGRTKVLRPLEHAFWRDSAGHWQLADLLLGAGAPMTAEALRWALRAEPTVVPVLAAHVDRMDRALVRRALQRPHDGNRDTVRAVRALLARVAAGAQLERHARASGPEK